MDISKVITQLTPVFTSLSEKIGQGGSWMFEVYVRQQYVLAAQDIVLGIIALILAVFLFKVYQKSEDEGALFSCVGFIIVSLVATFMLVAAAGHLINPQYGALQDLIGTFIPQPTN